jgi:hypothetical protein
MTKNYLIIDTETKNFLANTQHSFEKLESWPPPRQIAWQLFNNQQELIEEENYILDSDYDSRLNGALTKLNKVITQFNPIIVGHNISFDKNVLGAEYYKRELKNELINCESICTMWQTTEFCELENYKFPKLTELHHKLFDKEFEGAHDAMNDVKATAKCFFELMKLGIKLKPEKDNISNYPSYEAYINNLNEEQREKSAKCYAILELERLLEVIPSEITQWNKEINFITTNVFNYQMFPTFLTIRNLNQSKRKYFLDSLIKEFIDKYKLDNQYSEQISHLKNKGAKVPASHYLAFEAIRNPLFNVELIIKELSSIISRYKIFLFINRNSSSEDKIRSINELGPYDVYAYEVEVNGKNLNVMQTVAKMFSFIHTDIYKAPNFNEINKEFFIAHYKEISKALFNLLGKLENYPEMESLGYRLSIWKVLCDQYDAAPEDHKEYLKWIRDKYSPQNIQKQNEGCYIATLCYNDYNSKQVIVYRKFRDKILLKNRFGKFLVKKYYIYSPILVEKMKNRFTLQKLIKIIFLNPFYWLLCGLIKIIKT